MSEETTIVLLRMPETGEGISFRQVLDNCSYTVTEAFAKLFKIAEEAGYGLRVDFPKQGEQWWYGRTWHNANHEFVHTQCLILTPPAPEPEPNEWEAWCITRPMLKDYPDYHTHDIAMVEWHKRMPRCKCWKGEPE